MDNSHKRFLQTFLSKGMLYVNEVKDLYVACIREYSGRDCSDEWMQEIGPFVLNINNFIMPIGQEIKKGFDDETGQNFYALINTRESETSKLSSAYNRSQYNFIKKLVEAVVENEGSIGSTHALNLKLEPGVKDINKDDRQSLLRILEYNRWIKNKDGRISLSGRCILELEQFIIEQFPDSVSYCRMCKKLCVQGPSCSNCDTKLHVYCSNKYFKNAGKAACPDPDCQAPWESGVAS